MNADRLLAHYEQIADAPDALARLRRFVLDLAVRGKLVPQDANDEPASELLKRIAKEKARLVKTGEIRTPKAIPALPEAPFPIPSNWRWSQLAEIGVLSPRNEAPDTLEASFVPMPMIAAEYGVANQHEVRTWGEIKKGYTHFAEGDVGLAKITPCFENGKSAVFRNLTGGIGAGTTELHIVRPLFVDQDFILLFLKSPHFIETGIPKMTGTAGQKRVPTEYFAHSPFPLPPLAEQHRIVAKVDELMGLCDRLEAARAGRERSRDRLAAASLARLNAPDPETFQDDARFALDALPALTTRPDQIKRLRQTILNLAVRGKLVEGSAAKAATVGEYRTLQNGYAFKSTWFSKEGVRLLRNANIGHGEIRWNDVVHLPKDRLSEFERFQLNESDIVLTLDRPFIVTGTKVARISASDLPSLLLQRVGRFVETGPGLDDDYLFLWINSPHFNDQIDPGRSNGVPHISSKQVEAAEILVPPLAEQRRIVAKVDALIALCDRLEASLTATAATRRRLLDALLAEALAPVDTRELEAAE
jgi:type I restriction enzyme S subunit